MLFWATKIHLKVRQTRAIRTIQIAKSELNPQCLTTRDHETVFVVTEIWLPIPPTEDIEANSAGVQSLGVFSTVNEANACAEAQATKVEDLTKRKRDTDDYYEGFFLTDVDEDDPFSGRWQRTEPVEEYEDGTKTFKVLWGNRSTTVTVEEQTVHEDVGSAPAREVLHYPTADNWITRWPARM
jgi:hypothetical protein